MSVSNNIYPRSRAEDERIVSRSQQRFEAGMITDLDPISVPSNAVCDLVNMRATTTGLSGRTGSYKWSDATLPYYDSYIAGTISDNIVTVPEYNEFRFTPLMVGYKLKTADGMMIITGYIDSMNVNVVSTIVSNETILMSIRGPVNASIVDPKTNMSYYLIGTRIYRRRLDSNEFLEYSRIGGTTPESSISTFTRFNEYIILSNEAGVFTLNISSSDSSLYYWKSNEALPRYRVDSYATDELRAFGYKYLYGYTTIKNRFDKNRYVSTDVIELEIPPFYNDGTDKNDLDQQPIYSADNSSLGGSVVSYDLPISDGVTYPLKVISIFATKSIDAWSNPKLTFGGKIPVFEFYWRGNPYLVKLGTYTVKTIEDLAKRFQNAINEQVTYDINIYGSRERLYFQATNSASVFYLSGQAANNPGFDAATMYNLYSQYEQNIEFEGKVTSYNTFSYLRPGDNNHFTSYSVYRTKDVTPSLRKTTSTKFDDIRLQNKTEFYGLVDDVPVCKIFSGTIAEEEVADDVFEYVLTVDSGTALSKNDIGNTVYWDNETINGRFKLVSLRDDGKYVVIDDAPSFPDTFPFSFNAKFGVNHIVSLAIVDYTITGSSGDFDDLSVGDFVFFDDGTYDIVTSITSNNSIVEVLNTASKAEGLIGFDIIPRVYTDTTSDYILQGYMSEFPMNTAGFKPMPDNNIAAYTNGIYIAASRDKQFLDYSNAIDIARFGYHNESKQANNFIQDGVKAIIASKGGFSVMSPINTYLINPQQAYTAGDKTIGEAYSVLPDPELVASGRGATHQSKFSKGPDGGYVVSTNEPAIRIFNGTQYGEDMSDGKIKRNEIQKLDSMMLLAYDSNSGVYVWGTK